MRVGLTTSSLRGEAKPRRGNLRKFDEIAASIKKRPLCHPVACPRDPA
ncbi:hypothetical protein [Rickettsia felis]|nr:hypothetical protein [Rickettsia felis]